MMQVHSQSGRGFIVGGGGGGGGKHERVAA